MPRASSSTITAGRPERQLYSALWQADRSKIARCAPIEFIGRYRKGFFDYAIADEVHELKRDTAQGNALGTLAPGADRILGKNRTLSSFYTSSLTSSQPPPIVASCSISL
jgi:hypothetical protein